METKDIIEQIRSSNGANGQLLGCLLKIQCELIGSKYGAVVQLANGDSVNVLAIEPEAVNDDAMPEWLKGIAGSLNEAGQSCSAFEGINGSWYAIMPIDCGDLGWVYCAVWLEDGSRSGAQKAIEKLELSVCLLTIGGQNIKSGDSKASVRRLARAMEVLSVVNSQKRFVSMAMAFCNEIATQWQCEKASVGFLKGRYVQLKAMSGTENFSRKMELISDIEAAMEECLDQDVEVLWPCGDEVTYVSRAAANLGQNNKDAAVLSLPLRIDGDCFAVLSVQRPKEMGFTIEEIETLRLVCELCGASLKNMNVQDRWFGSKLMMNMRNSLGMLVGAKHTWAKMLSVLICGFLVFMFVAKGDYKVQTSFNIEATYLQSVPAPFDGYIKEVNVEVGQLTKEGQTVLAALDTVELRLKLAEYEAERAEYQVEKDAANNRGDNAVVQIYQAKIAKVDSQIDLLKYYLANARIVSPISGCIVKGDLKRKINSPVKTGDVLFEVAQLESLRGQLQVPEDQVLDVVVGQQGYLATASYPGQRIKFTVEKVSPVAEVINQRNVFMTQVKLEERPQWLRPGMEGVAKIYVQEKSYAWIWTRKIRNWFKMKFWL
ncbi:MAG: HlyD family efflux transporter periplasmic adaptor subunit [Phycisphaerae bacterium]|nr:HlyD family efflux transporter periplasmic adaptor subunit [Phycisphaerae bacterium]